MRKRIAGSIADFDRQSLDPAALRMNVKSYLCSDSTWKMQRKNI